mmetsp:Transcript_10144/g.20496  ORF Transcript_10144/g.20496 Transcript_10144/m.20496 type:complete len:88 (-) Transcript_10144:95-358(-)
MPQSPRELSLSVETRRPPKLTHSGSTNPLLSQPLSAVVIPMLWRRDGWRKDGLDKTRDGSVPLSLHGLGEEEEGRNQEQHGLVLLRT